MTVVHPGPDPGRARGPAVVGGASGTLTASGVGVRRSGRWLLDDVSVEARPHRMLAVTGASGSGKTTLLSVLAGLVAPDAGAVQWGGEPVPVDRPAHLRRVGLVLQLHGLVSVLTAVENVEVVLKAQRLPRREVRRRAAETLERVGLGGLSDRLVEQLSGGQQQRVAVARALCTAPALLLADEPTSELDAANRDAVVGELRREAERGAVVVVATHDPDVAAACDSILSLADGRMVDTSG
jgi:putative ABC transport system ATP-binding protein